ncbi:SAC3/GANP/Nin1/mts3/eIF-3 p25 family-domain-containing protein [Mucidula mucida]|nr:SAC3/GANP/Nin1/mts3/eIF-3 p25 family-domain-containing protein [Mucidula mucida]
MSAASWPPQLKDWVAKCLGQMTDSNKSEAQAELRKVIADAFAAQTLWTTDWAGVQLLLPKPPPSITNLKRKTVESPAPAPISKKTKKAAKLAASSSSSDFSDPAALNRRAQRFQREHDIERQKSLKSNHLQFQTSSRISLYGSREDSVADPNVIDWDRHTIVGTSTTLFKDYLRLTSEPKPEQIRPYPILQQTLVELKKRWKDKSSYDWICNQFKSLRQDLTVQRIKNDFTVKVYEIHARIALESNDMVEFNQCQSTLKNLYELGIPGEQSEFTAYRILMLLHGRNRSELNLYVGQLTRQQKEDPVVQHALSVQRALTMGNYHSLFKLYMGAPKMGGYIMDHLIARERAKALIVISKAYKVIPLNFLHKELAFSSLEETLTFLSEHSVATYTNPNSSDKDKILDLKSASSDLLKAYDVKYRRVNIKGAI